jgi:hypothetical protein
MRTVLEKILILPRYLGAGQTRGPCFNDMIQAGGFVDDDKVEREAAPLNDFPRTIDLNHKCNVSL